MEKKKGFEETDLSLGLGLGLGLGLSAASEGGEALRKRGFSETETEADTTNVDLMLNLSSSKKEADPTHKSTDPAKPPPKAQVVGWPPVRSYRKNMVAVQQKRSAEESEKNNNGSFVKVSMDGAPYLRKVDLKMYNTYQDLSDSLGNMFSSFTIDCGSEGMKELMNESKLMDLLNGSDYVPTYEDKDGDWMLVGDVPWEMFVESCKRLRIMKGKEAIGLAPRAMEKCKNRS